MIKGSLTPNALRVLEARYLKRDDERNVVETPEQLIHRVAKAVAQAESLFGHNTEEKHWEDSFHQFLGSLDFLPNSPALMNAGMPLGQLSACFVLPVEDTMEDIFETLKHAALVQRTGGGTGFSFSKLRPKGDLIRSTGGEASGPVSFMKIFDHTTQYIKQGGRRRGANMAVLRVDHPDILDFVTAKVDGTSLQNFNLSVGVTDKFLDAVRTESDFDLVHPQTQQVTGRVSAKLVFESIVNSVWETGDPGLLFLDAINRTNPTPALGQLDATNPCGEIPLLAYESCNLGSINLARHVKQGSEGLTVDWDKLKKTVHLAIRFLDNLIEINQFPTPEIESMSRGNRKIGLGVMGLADLLIHLGVPYDSEKGIKLGETIMGVIQEEAHATSRLLAEERGVFPNWMNSIYGQKNQKMRNATCTAIAPTGTISIVAGTTPSIEPLFAVVYRRSHSLGGKPLYEMSPWFEAGFQNYGIRIEEFKDQILAKGGLSSVEGIPETMKRIFVTALEIPAEGHLKMQAAFQRHVDNSVSKTINLPEETIREEIAQAYLRAWELGLKGVTVFRYGSKGSQVLEIGPENDPGFFEHMANCDPRECQV
jgi:ribonucleoside-diphosphate reductase alpha chain